MHIGVEVRVRLTNLPEGQQDIIRTNSDLMYWMSKYTANGDWSTLLQLEDFPLAIETRPVELPDDYPEV